MNNYIKMERTERHEDGKQERKDKIYEYERMTKKNI
jgi:hypothetical protein